MRTRPLRSEASIPCTTHSNRLFLIIGDEPVTFTSVLCIAGVWQWKFFLRFFFSIRICHGLDPDLDTADDESPPQSEICLIKQNSPMLFIYNGQSACITLQCNTSLCDRIIQNVTLCKS